jgi:hypothetical protein
MKNETIIKVFRNFKKQPKKYSLGFKRLVSLPKDIRHKISISCMLKGEFNDHSVKFKLDKMTNQEYVNWMRKL